MLTLLMVKNLPEMKLDTEIKHQSQSVLVNQMFQFLIKNKPIITTLSLHFLNKNIQNQEVRY